MTSRKDGIQPIILDCNVWITDFLQTSSPLQMKVMQEAYQVVLTSYMVVEILRVLKRLSVRLSVPFSELESFFWNTCSFSFINLKFQQPLTESIIAEVKRVPEFRIIAKLLDLETKDVPYLVAAFQYNAILVSNDLRSLVSKRTLIHKNLDVKILTTAEFLELTL